MIIKEKLGNLKIFENEDRVIDRLPLEWFETSKRIVHKQTISGKDLVLKFLNEAQHLQQDDVLYADDHLLIVVEIIACDAIVIRPSSMYEMAYACYEIGNKHLPLFFEANEILIPFETPLFNLLEVSGFKPTKEKRKLLHQLRTSILPHPHVRSDENLITTILTRTISSHA